MIGFRVDANEKIATGHLMRCIAIAAECRRRGEECLFLMAEEKEASRLKDKKIPYRVLHTQWDDMESEIPAMKKVVKQEKLDWLVVDSYQVTACYLASLNRCVPVLYIDDMAEEKYQVSALLHYGLCPDLTAYRERYRNADTEILAGVEFIPLREEFLPEESRQEREKSILITTGGTDPYDMTGKILLCCLEQEAFLGYQFHVIVGSMNQNEESLQNLALQHSRIQLHKNVLNMSEYMRRCEVAVSAGGTTLFELCACGIPTVCFSFADNQLEGTREMGKRNVMQYAGDARQAEADKKVVEQLLFFVQNREAREEYADRMTRLVDGCGTSRIAALLMRKQ